MNATAAPMNRIQKTSRYIRLVTQYGLPILGVLIFLTNFVPPNHLLYVPARALIKLLRPFSTPSSDTSSIHYVNLALGIVNLLIFIFFLRLLWLFEKGKLFNQEVVRCIKILGVLSIASAVVDWWFQIICLPIFLENPERLRLTEGLVNILEGLFIFFIAWIMDEARKIREEQELTV